MKELLAKPGFLGFYGTIGADLSQLLAMFFTLFFLIGWYQAKKGLGNNHHWLVLGGMTSMLAYFTSYYLFRQLGVLAFEGREGFGGPDFMYNNIFIPILTIHILLVIIGIVMAIYLIILGFRAQSITNGHRILKRGELRVSRDRLQRIFGITGGVLLFLFFLRSLMGGFSIRRMMVYVIGVLLIGAVLGVEKGIERIFPDGSRRHRTLGKFTMILYAILLVTGTVTYVMLYILYPPKIE